MCENVVYDDFVIKKRKLGSKDLESLSKEDLIRRIVQLEQHVNQLRNIITKKGLSSDSKRIKRNVDVSKFGKRHIAIKFLYLGWEYDGFVEQEDSINTVEYYLFEALKNGSLIESRQTSNYHRCGRTDKGVSSFSQVISVTVRSKLTDPGVNDVENELPYCKIINAFLPKSIRALSWAPVSEDFSARFDCISRTYKYWFPKGDLDVEKMNEGIQNMIGTHDFRNLCKMDIGNGVTNFVRTINSGSVSICSRNTLLNEREYDMCELTLTAPSFLWHQIRYITSVLFLVGQKKEEPSVITKLVDIDTYPKKPQYKLADSTPLNLFDCEYDTINWIVDESFAQDVFSTLQTCWAAHSVKCVMLEEMIKHCRNHISHDKLNTKPYLIFFNDILSKVYKPLLCRQTGRSLDDGINYFVKKGKIESYNANISVHDDNKQSNDEIAQQTWQSESDSVSLITSSSYLEFSASSTSSLLGNQYGDEQ